MRPGCLRRSWKRALSKHALHKMLAHLASDRMTMIGKRWPTTQMAKDVLDVVSAWAAGLPVGPAKGRVVLRCHELKVVLSG